MLVCPNNSGIIVVKRKGVKNGADGDRKRKPLLGLELEVTKCCVSQ